MAPSLDKNYANLKLYSSESSITFTPSEAWRAMRAKSALQKATVGGNRRRQEADPKLFIRA